MPITSSPGPIAPATIGGFSTVRKQRRRRMVVAVAGLDKCGKTHQALTAPGPTAYGNYDTGLEGVVDKFTRDGKIIYSKDYRLAIPPGVSDINQISAIATKLWEEFKGDMRNAWASSLLRTTVIDTESDMWGLVRMARFGKLTQVMPHHYGPVNAEYAGFLNEVYDTDKNLVLLCKMKYEYNEQTKKYTDTLIRSGYKELQYLVQVNVQAFSDPNVVGPDKFGIRVINCRQNPDLQGLELTGEAANFLQLAQFVFPDSEPSEWE